MQTVTNGATQRATLQHQQEWDVIHIVEPSEAGTVFPHDPTTHQAQKHHFRQIRAEWKKPETVGGNATPPLHSRGSSTPATGSKKSELVPNKEDQNKRCLPHPYPLGGPKEGGNPTPRLHSQGPPTPTAGGKKLSSRPKQRGPKSEVATSPLPSQRTKRGRKYYVTALFSGIPNAKHGEQTLVVVANKGEKNQKCLPQPCLLGGL